MLSSSLSSWSAQGVSEAATAGTRVTETECTATAADRLLTARLSYTSAQRGAGQLDQCRVDDGILLSFPYKVLGFSTGLHEGVLLGSAEPCPLPRLKEVAREIGASLLKITRIALEPAEAGRVYTYKVRRWRVVHRSARARELLPLRPTYEETLANFGRHTRRNIRNARKVAAESRFTFHASTGPKLISAIDHAGLARQTRPNGVRVTLSQRLEAHADQSGNPFRSVVRTPQDEIVSYVCGYFGEPAVAYLLYQLNDPAFSALSPSLLHRAHLIEWLIERGCEELVFVHGCTGVLQHACLRQPLEELLLMRRTPVGYLTASPIAFAKADSSLGRLVRAAVLPAS